MKLKHLLRGLPCLAMLVLPWLVCSAEGPSVILARSRNYEVILDLTSEFKKNLLGARPQVEVEDYFVRTPLSFIERVKSRQPDLVVAVGIEPVVSAAGHIEGIPLIFSGIMKAELSQELEGRAAGVLLDVPLSFQVEYLQKIMPTVKTVGIIYNDFENSETIKEAEQILEKEGIILRKFVVSSVKEINAIKKFHVNALIIIPDSIVCQPVVMRHLFKSSLQQRVPVVGISAAYARAGAVLAFSPNYKEIGVQLAELAIRVLDGESPAAMPITFLRKADCFVNRAVAKHLGVRIPREMLREAAEVFGR